MTGYFRCENGQVLEMDLPLAEAFAARVARGEIVRVANAAGDAWEDDQAVPVATDVDPDAGDLLRARVGELEAEVDLATKQRDQLANEVTELREQLAAAQATIAELEAAASTKDSTTKPSGKSAK